MKIVNITESPKLTKRYRVFLNNNNQIEHYDFGLDGGSTYLDHKDPIKRQNYWLRHYGNTRERHLIQTLTPSPATFSAYLLWGNSTSLKENIKDLNKLFSEKN